MPRKGNDLAFAWRAAAAGMAGILVKSHFTSTADRAALIDEVVPGVRVYGALCFYHSSGGINPIAVETAGRSGARLILVSNGRRPERAGPCGSLQGNEHAVLVRHSSGATRRGESPLYRFRTTEITMAGRGVWRFHHFLDTGFTRDEVRTMVFDNPADLVKE
jgi:hypothetical protein